MSSSVRARPARARRAQVIGAVSAAAEIRSLACAARGHVAPGVSTASTVGARPRCDRGARVIGAVSAAADIRSLACAPRGHAARRVNMTVAASARAVPGGSARVAAARVAADIRARASPTQACLAGVDTEVRRGAAGDGRDMADCVGGLTGATRGRHDKAEFVLADDLAVISPARVLSLVVVVDLRGRRAIESPEQMGARVVRIAVIGITGAIASPVTRAIRQPVAVGFTLQADVGIAVCVAVAIAFIDAVVPAEVVKATCAVGMTGSIRVAGVNWIVTAAGVAVAAHGAVAGLRGGGDEPPVVDRAPAARRALGGGPVLRQQAEQGKQQASHAIHLLVGIFMASAPGG